MDIPDIIPHGFRSQRRPHMPALVNPVVERIFELMKVDPELREVDREVMRCALLTLAHRVMATV